MLTSESNPSVQPSPKGGEKRQRIVRKLTVFSALPAAALLSQLDAGFIAYPSDRSTLLTLWEKGNRAYNLQGGAFRSFLTSDDVRQPNLVDEGRIAEMLKRAKAYGPFDSHPTRIFNVRISKLVTPQIAINLSRAEKRSKIAQGLTETELFDIAFESAGLPEPITRQALGIGSNGGALLFTSYDEDIRLHHPPEYRRIPINEKDQSSPTFESICFPVGGGLPFASAYRVQVAPDMSRLILNNGIHRVYSLASAGYAWCPLLVSDLVAFELPDPFVDFPRSVLLDPGSNPPLITDFLNSDVVIPLAYNTLLKTVRFNWNFEQYVTVLK